ncbi:MAG: T9SS C-terminal target domain-containing protein [Bacteroidetes bacterium]|nr:MAG: T9SS C-terminal target domain-containing protein [Bacteroidota bacterium]
MQKKFYLSLSALLLSIFSFGQITIDEDYFPAIGDTLFTAVDNMPSNIDVQADFGEHTWNFASLQSPFTRQRVVRDAEEGSAADQFPGADFVLETSDGIGEGYYQIVDGRYQMIGFAGDDPIGLNFNLAAIFDPPYVERTAPMELADLDQFESAILYAFSPDDLPVNIFEDLPITPDSLRIRVAIDQTYFVDGWGTLTIPGGIFDVLRQKRTEIRETRLDALVGFLGWQDVTDIALGAIGDENITEALGKDTIVEYHFYSNEAKEAIAIVEMDDTGEIVNGVEYKSLDVVNNVQQVSALKPGVYAFPNPVIVNARFEFSNLPKDTYNLTIYNIIGEPLWNKKYYIDRSHVDKVDVSFLRKGTYLYSLSNSEGRTIVTKRLVVIRP